MTADEQIKCAKLPKAELIAQLNDGLRKTLQSGSILIRRSVRNLEGFNALKLMAALADYDRFDADNDPHGERDMGNFALFNTELYFKIDYFDPDLKFGSDDPADASRTHRVITIMTKEDF